ncbi:MAG TPA: hypothetical protein VJ728_11775 [Candidatus Binataceae bacterium]|nr:hypothetical protein [Candidatus Binataceae bacterium]
MGTTIKLSRPRAVIRHSRIKSTPEQESLEARRSLFILVGSFFVTAVVMCVVVVAMVASTWTGVIIMSAFVLVFALLKIVLADALIYAMLRYDATCVDVPVQPGPAPIKRYRRYAPFGQTRGINGRRNSSPEPRKLRVASGDSRSTPL